MDAWRMGGWRVNAQIIQMCVGASSGGRGWEGMMWFVIEQFRKYCLLSESYVMLLINWEDKLDINCLDLSMMQSQHILVITFGGVGLHRGGIHVEINFVVLEGVIRQKPKLSNIPYTNLVIYYVDVRRNDKHMKDKMRFNTI